MLCPPPRAVSRPRDHVETLVQNLDAFLHLADSDDLAVQRGVHLSDLAGVLQEDAHAPASAAMELRLDVLELAML